MRSPLLNLDCDELYAPDHLWLGLTDYPIVALCTDTEPGDETYRPRGLYDIGCFLSPTGANYVIYRDGEFPIIETVEQLQETFAPIESPEEALSYAILATGYNAMYEDDFQNLADDYEEDGVIFHQRVIEESFAEEAVNGFRVHLFYNYSCSCTPWSVDAVEILVHRDGTFDQISSQRILEYGTNIDMCVD